MLMRTKMDVFVLFLSVGVFGLFYQYFRKYVAGGVCTSKARMDGKTVIVTGANAGLGKETALDLARRGARIVMACRDLAKARVAKDEIVRKTGNEKIVLKKVDLASLKSIREFAEDILNTESRIDVLINNAGIAYPETRLETENGFELTMGVNHFGPFLLTNLLVDLLKKSAPSRVIVVASTLHYYMAKSLKFDNLDSKMSYEKFDAYAQSKLANILFARELAKRLAGSGVTVNALHPGVIFTGLPRHLPTYIQKVSWLLCGAISKTPEQGAQTTIHLAVSEEVQGVSGLYFADCKPKEPSKYAQDDGDAKKLWEISADRVGLNSTI